MRIFIDGVGLIGPGLNGWHDSLAVLAGTAPYIHAPVSIPPGDLLPAAERRRTGLPVKIALAVGQEAIVNARLDAADLPVIFASSAGDGENMHCIFEMLANNGHELSPTRFHNSVHNAPSGYWSIATKSSAPTTSLAHYDESFVAGLIEAAVQTLAGSKPVALLAYDAPYPQPLHAVRPISASFGVALVLNSSRTDHSLAELEVRFSRNGHASTLVADTALEALRLGTPAARSLPLLAALAARTLEKIDIPDRIYFDYQDDSQLDVVIHPC